jgi:hypothetical protein
MTNEEVDRVKALAWKRDLTTDEVDELKRLALKMVPYVDVGEGLARTLGLRKEPKG